jgi:hypothetical protein
VCEPAVVEVDEEILPRRIGIPKKAIHLQIVKLHKVNEAGDIWALMDALNERLCMPKKAIHLQIVKLYKVNEAGDIWALMDALNERLCMLLLSHSR